MAHKSGPWSEPTEPLAPGRTDQTIDEERLTATLPARLLVVDDRPTTRKILATLFDAPTFRVTEAASGHSAIDLIESGNFDLVLLDCILPDMNGLAVLQHIRRSHAKTELPVIMVTVKSKSHNVVQALAVGANDYVVKPIDPPVLQARVNTQLSLKRAEDAVRYSHRHLEHRVKEQTAALRVLNQALRDEISEREKIQAALRDSRERFRDFAETAADWFWETDPAMRFVYLSGSYEELLGVSAETILGQTSEQLFAAGVQQNDEAWEQHLEDIASHRAFEGFETAWSRPDGQTRILRISGKPNCDAHGRFQGYRGTGRDITESYRFAEKIAHQASHDPLTGLVNRRELERRLKRALNTAGTQDATHILCYLDLDSFKVINDSCGHAAGDKLLEQLGGMLRSHVRQRDTVARLGGDEFGILMERCALEQAVQIAEALRHEIESFRFAWGAKIFRIGASIGLVPITSSARNAQSILSDADAACYMAKEKGRNRIYVRDTSENSGSEAAAGGGERKDWLERICTAIEESQLRLSYLPITPLGPHFDTGRRYELLLSLSDDGGSVPPGAFIPIAERYNIASRLDRWVIETSFAWLREHPQHLDELRLCAINLSAQSLRDNSMIAFLRKQLEEKKIPSEKICFEIGETAALANLTTTIEFTQALGELGCCSAIDDFGASFTALGHLKNLPVGLIKIDGTLIRGIASDPVRRAIVSCIAEVARALGKQTVAEFVDNSAILEELRAIGVDHAQGHACSEPQPFG